jgi:hypothetical protein
MSPSLHLFNKQQMTSELLCEEPLSMTSLASQATSTILTTPLETMEQQRNHTFTSCGISETTRPEQQKSSQISSILGSLEASFQMI